MPVCLSYRFLEYSLMTKIPLEFVLKLKLIYSIL